MWNISDIYWIFSAFIFVVYISTSMYITFNFMQLTALHSPPSTRYIELVQISTFFNNPTLILNSITCRRMRFISCVPWLFIFLFLSILLSTTIIFPLAQICQSSFVFHAIHPIMLRYIIYYRYSYSSSLIKQSIHHCLVHFTCDILLHKFTPITYLYVAISVYYLFIYLYFTTFITTFYLLTSKSFFFSCLFFPSIFSFSTCSF